MKRRLVGIENNRYLIPVDGQVVSRLYIDYALGIQLLENGITTIVRIEGIFSLTENNQKLIFNTHQRDKLCPAFTIFEKTIKSAIAYKNGRLKIIFNNGTSLNVEPDPNYEAWEISGDDGLIIVCQPGGEITIWQPFKDR